MIVLGARKNWGFVYGGRLPPEVTLLHETAVDSLNRSARILFQHQYVPNSMPSNRHEESVLGSDKILPCQHHNCGENKLEFLVCTRWHVVQRVIAARVRCLLSCSPATNLSNVFSCCSTSGQDLSGTAFNDGMYWWMVVVAKVSVILTEEDSSSWKMV